MTPSRLDGLPFDYAWERRSACVYRPLLLPAYLNAAPCVLKYPDDWFPGQSRALPAWESAPNVRYAAGDLGWLVPAAAVSATSRFILADLRRWAAETTLDMRALAALALYAERLERGDHLRGVKLVGA
jgi:hypothetical protein